MEFYTFIYHVYIYVHIYLHRGSRPLISDSGEIMNGYLRNYDNVYYLQY